MSQVNVVERDRATRVESVGGWRRFARPRYLESGNVTGCMASTARRQPPTSADAPARGLIGQRASST